MPCDSIQTSFITWGPTTDTKLLAQALHALGYTQQQISARRIYASNRDGSAVQYTVSGHSMNITTSYGDPLQENAIKKAYSVEAVKKTAAKMGWKLNQKSTTQFLAQRRY
jgi:hypothetical protein